MKKNEINMLEGAIFSNIVKVALPLAFISILQQFFNAADVAVVGRFASSNALAAVGANTPIVNMFLTFFTGLATGGNVAISMQIGKDEKDKISSSVHTISLLAFICSMVLILVGEVFAHPLLSMIHTPETVFNQALLYLRIYLFAMAFAVIYNFASAILRSKGDTQRPLYCLIFSGVLNVLLNLFFVIVLHMDVVGVALATLISNIVCAFSTFVLLMKEPEPFTLKIRQLRFDYPILRMALKIGLPAGVQGMLFSISNIMIQSGINQFGPDCIAGNTAAMNFEFISYFIVAAFGQTVTTFISQNYAAGKYDRCRKIFRQSIAGSVLFCLCASLCFTFFREFWLGLFSTDPNVLEYATIRMFIVVLLESFTTFNEIPAGGLRGMGISMPPTIIAILGSCVFRIVWMATIFAWYPTIIVLMLVYPVSWFLISIGQMGTYLYYEKKKV